MLHATVKQSNITLTLKDTVLLTDIACDVSSMLIASSNESHCRWWWADNNYLIIYLGYVDRKFYIGDRGPNSAAKIFK